MKRIIVVLSCIPLFVFAMQKDALQTHSQENSSAIVTPACSALLTGASKTVTCAALAHKIVQCASGDNYGVKAIWENCNNPPTIIDQNSTTCNCITYN